MKKFLNSSLQQFRANAKLTQCERSMRCLSPGVVHWLQTLLQCVITMHNLLLTFRECMPTFFLRRWQETRSSVHLHCISETF